MILKDMNKMPRINTDEIVKFFGDWKNLSDVMKAGRIAVNRINGLLNTKKESSFVFLREDMEFRIRMLKCTALSPVPA